MGEDSEKSTKEKSSSTKASSSSEHVEKGYATDSAATTPSSATAATDGSSIVVQPGEGAASIAARAGISVDELQRLNPDHMTNGYWFANPGDVVKVQ
ncbi:SAG1386/EF1546 family surface-associated protein, partial [Streptococcus thermophilus]|uniref:SAG1386/EF1546 family surface-associated protein n=1 Tax=Streptococcus thermophilus TaxID=1308 RepID=UPI0022FDAAA7